MAAAGSTIALPIVFRLLKRWNVVDMPKSRSSHSTPIPRGAGIALGIGVICAWLVSGAGELVLITGLILMCALGAVDDFRSLPAVPRLIVQIVISLGLVGTFLTVDSSRSDLVGVGSIAIVWLVGTVNATNFMDGINGLSAISGVLIGGTYWILASEETSKIEWIAPAVVGACLAFLPWNWGGRAKFFLGDSGSYLLGASLGVMGIILWLEGLPLVVAVAPMSIYWLDVATTLVRRLLQRKQLTTAHRDHVYQRLVDYGLSHPFAALSVGTFTALVCLISLAASKGIFASLTGLLLVVTLSAVYVFLPRLLRNPNQIASTDHGSLS